VFREKRLSAREPYGVQDPAAAHVPRAGAAMGQYSLIIAAGVFQGIGQDRQGGEVLPVAGVPGDGPHARAQPGWDEADGTEGIAENVTQQGALMAAVLDARPARPRRRAGRGPGRPG